MILFYLAYLAQFPNREINMIGIANIQSANYDIECGVDWET